MNRKYLNEITGYEGLNGYSVTDDGRVWSHMKRHDKTWILLEEPYREIKPSYDNKGYLKVRLSNYNKKISLRIHRLIAMAFIPNPHNKPQVNHKDGNKLNNNVDNLEWVTNKENHEHKCANGLNVAKSGKEHYLYGIVGNEHPKSTRVKQMDYDGNVIKIFDSMTVAANELGVHYSGISKCCHGKIQSCKGYKWEFVNEGSTTIENEV